jgi:hypothetical protein
VECNDNAFPAGTGFFNKGIRNAFRDLALLSAVRPSSIVIWTIGIKSILGSQ